LRLLIWAGGEVPHPIIICYIVVGELLGGAVAGPSYSLLKKAIASTPLRMPLAPRGGDALSVFTLLCLPHSY